MLSVEKVWESPECLHAGLSVVAVRAALWEPGTSLRHFDTLRFVTFFLIGYMKSKKVTQSWPGSLNVNRQGWWFTSQVKSVQVILHFSALLSDCRISRISDWESNCSSSDRLRSCSIELKLPPTRKEISFSLYIQSFIQNQHNFLKTREKKKSCKFGKKL